MMMHWVKMDVRNAWVGWIAGRPLYAVLQGPTHYRVYLFGNASKHGGTMIYIAKRARLRDAKQFALRHHRHLVGADP